MTLLIKIRHFVCMVLVMCFTTTTVAWSAPDMSLSFSSLSVHSYDGLKTNPSQVLLLPKEIATVQKIYQSPNKKAPTLFHIQDAHASFQAQQNITNTLMHLVEEQKIDAIFVEGAMGRLDPKILSLDDNENDREKVIKKLKEYGVLGGIESFLLENEVKTFGVEEEKLYLQNLTDYRSAFAFKNARYKVSGSSEAKTDGRSVETF
jgi:membrane glycosyltransferase